MPVELAKRSTAGGKFLRQVDVLTKIMTEAQTADAISRLPDLLAAARGAGMMVIDSSSPSAPVIPR